MLAVKEAIGKRLKPSIWLVRHSQQPSIGWPGTAGDALQKLILPTSLPSLKRVAQAAAMPMQKTGATAFRAAFRQVS